MFQSCDERLRVKIFLCMQTEFEVDALRVGRFQINVDAAPGLTDVPDLGPIVPDLGRIL
jgi:hypothetical protein